KHYHAYGLKFRCPGHVAAMLPVESRRQSRSACLWFGEAAYHAVSQAIYLLCGQLVAEGGHATIGPVLHRVQKLSVAFGMLPCWISEIGSMHRRNPPSLSAM